MTHSYVPCRNHMICSMSQSYEPWLTQRPIVRVMTHSKNLNTLQSTTHSYAPWQNHIMCAMSQSYVPWLTQRPIVCAMTHSKTEIHFKNDSFACAVVESYHVPCRTHRICTMTELWVEWLTQRPRSTSGHDSFMSAMVESYSNMCVCVYRIIFECVCVCRYTWRHDSFICAMVESYHM